MILPPSADSDCSRMVIKATTLTFLNLVPLITQNVFWEPPKILAEQYQKC